MKVYVANCTKQVQDFIYRLPEYPTARMQRIEVGTQQQLSGDLTAKDIEYIVKQHAKYGFIPVDEVDRSKPFIGMCYSVDKPVQVEKLRRALAHNDEVMVERGREIRKEMAVAVADAVEKDIPGAHPTFELSAEEIPAKDSPQDATFHEGVRVTRKTDDRGEPDAGRRRRSGRG